MQAIYLMSSKDFDETHIGRMFLAFGLAQFICMAPAGYFLDYSNRKLFWVSLSGGVCAVLTVLSALTADKDQFWWMIVLKVVQGAVTAILPPGFNAITMGIVGSTGFTRQVSRNRMMNHIGTALVVASGSLVAYGLYPNIGALFVVSPLAALGVWYYLRQILPNHVNKDAARGLILQSPTMDEYELADDVAECKRRAARVSSEGNPAPASWDLSSGSESASRESSEYRRLSGAEMRSPNCGQGTPSRAPAQVAAPRAVSSDVETENQVPNTNSGVYRPPELLAGALDPPSTTAGRGKETIEVARGRSDERTVLQPSVALPSHEIQRQSSRTSSLPSFNLGWQRGDTKGVKQNMNPQTPLDVLKNPNLLIFTTVIFFFHLANSSVLPLVMQSLALKDVQSGILLSGLCILIAQGCMAFFAKLCGDFSPYWGRKNLMLAGLASLTVRCFMLTLLVSAEDTIQTRQGAIVLKTLILSTQFLDSVGAGIIGTLQILVTSDLSGGTGRFSLLLGFTTAAMCLGATVSGYMGQALAHDHGYSFAFTALGILSLIPFVLYVFAMPETLPDYARPIPIRNRRRRLRELLRKLNDSRRRILQSKRNPFRSGTERGQTPIPVDSSPLSKAVHKVELV